MITSVWCSLSQALSAASSCNRIPVQFLSPLIAHAVTSILLRDPATVFMLAMLPFGWAMTLLYSCSTKNNGPFISYLFLKSHLLGRGGSVSLGHHCLKDVVNFVLSQHTRSDTVLFRVPMPTLPPLHRLLSVVSFSRPTSRFSTRWNVAVAAAPKGKAKFIACFYVTKHSWKGK